MTLADSGAVQLVALCVMLVLALIIMFGPLRAAVAHGAALMSRLLCAGVRIANAASTAFLSVSAISLLSWVVGLAVFASGKALPGEDRWGCGYRCQRGCSLCCRFSDFAIAHIVPPA